MAAYRLGLQNFNNKNYAQAIQQFKLAQAIGKPSFDTLYNLGRAYRQYAQSYKEKDAHLYQDQMKLAAEQFDAAARLKPDAFNAYFQLGMCYREMALYPQAATAFKTALRLTAQRYRHVVPVGDGGHGAEVPA